MTSSHMVSSHSLISSLYCLCIVLSSHDYKPIKMFFLKSIASYFVKNSHISSLKYFFLLFFKSLVEKLVLGDVPKG